MIIRTSLGVSTLTITTALLSVGLGLAGCDRKADQTTNGGGAPAGTAPDNTAKNKDDQNSQTKTPMDQSNSSSDIKITADIRRAIMAESGMSINAQNCKIITDKGGVVTLRGPVASQAEKDSIEAKAKAAAGVNRVINELEVKP